MNPTEVGSIIGAVILVIVGTISYIAQHYQFKGFKRQVATQLDTVPDQVDKRIDPVVSSLKFGISELTGAMSILTNSLSSVQSAQDSAVARNVTLEQGLSDYRNLTRDLLDEKKTYLDEQAKIRSQLNGLMDLQNESREKQASFERDIKVVRGDLSSALDKVKVLTGENTALRTEQDINSARIKEIEAAREKSEAERNRLNDELQAAKVGVVKEVETYQTRINNQAIEITNLKEKLRALQQELDDTKRDFQQYKEQNHAEREKWQVEQAPRQLENLRNRLAFEQAFALLTDAQKVQLNDILKEKGIEIRRTFDHLELVKVESAGAA